MRPKHQEPPEQEHRRPELLSASGVPPVWEGQAVQV